ncbi:hypothetical protein PV619_003760 [Salmonella enterica]|nr:hypothetical protein [Salmonella enterica]EKT7009006.1 hypothetical protein [Salmonella enterica]
MTAGCQQHERAAEKLWGEHQFCRHISVFIKTFPFAINEAYYGNVASEKLFLTTRGIPGHLEHIWLDGHRYCRISYMFMLAII